MPAVVEVAYSISLEGSPLWKVGPDLVRTFNDQAFIKLRAHDCGFIRMLCYNHLELPKKTRFSLAQVEGFRSLQRLRNDAAFVEARPRDDGADDLFGGNVKQEKKPRTRLNASQLQELRANPEVFEFEVPGVGNNPALLITATRPVHPTDDICIKLDGDTIEHITLFIRHGLTIEALTTRRSYGTATPGLWNNGSAGLVQRLDEGTEVDGVPKRFRSMNVASIPLMDGDAHEPTSPFDEHNVERDSQDND